MNVYKPGSDLGELEESNFLEEIGARILEGNPNSVSRLDFDDSVESGGRLCSGVYGVTPGKFEVDYSWNEIATVLEGRIRLTDSKGVVNEIGPGESFFVAAGETITWEVLEETRKCFFYYM